jgi:hypothetical protein
MSDYGIDGAPITLLRLENLAIMSAATLSYALLHADWQLFAVLFLIPDLSMAGYLLNPKFGSIVYNIGHWYVLPIILFGYGILTKSAFLPVGLIWIVHIAFDRTLGFGLKYPGNFKDTHLSG